MVILAHQNRDGVIMRKPVCSKCGNDLEDNRIGKQRYCKSCHCKNMRENRPKHSELSEMQRIKSNARSYANVYLRRGVIKKMPCEICGSPLSQIHHKDYSLPLVVSWLCRDHHLETHRQNS